MTSIPGGAFKFCYNLETVIIGNSVTVIGNQAFHRCDALESITIPASVTSIEYYALNTNGYVSSVIKHVYYTGTPEQWAAITIDESNYTLLNSTIHYI